VNVSTTHVLDSVDRLDPLPATVQRLIALLGDERAPLKAVVEIIEHDPAATANVLRMANSSLFPGRRVDSVQGAVNRLGTVELLNLALSEVVRGMVQPAPAYGLTGVDLWLHAVATQSAAAEFQRRIRHVELPGIVSTAALVHDVGKLLLARFFAADQDTLAHTAEDLRGDWLAAERELTGFDHAALGAVIAERWNFPETLVKAIRLHHTVRTEFDPIIDVIVAADLAAHSLGHGCGRAGGPNQYDPRAFDRLALNVPTFSSVVIASGARIQQVRSTFKI
jgi:putative nucleotidyltransferase with HDIG domain